MSEFYKHAILELEKHNDLVCLVTGRMDELLPEVSPSESDLLDALRQAVELVERQSGSRSEVREQLDRWYVAIGYYGRVVLPSTEVWGRPHARIDEEDYYATSDWQDFLKTQVHP